MLHIIRVFFFKKKNKKQKNLWYSFAEHDPKRNFRSVRLKEKLGGVDEVRAKVKFYCKGSCHDSSRNQKHKRTVLISRKF